MTKSKIVETNRKIEEKVVGAYKGIEASVTGGFGRMVQSVTGVYEKIENAFVDEFLTKEGESVGEAKKRLKSETDIQDDGDE